MLNLKILMVPDDSNPYPGMLKSQLEDRDVKVKFLPSFEYFNPRNIASYVLKILYNRLLGYRIIHVHWLFIFPFKWQMKLITYYCRTLGYRIVWEMHNIVAHGGGKKEAEKSRWFYKHCDSIVFHSKSDIERSELMLGVGPKGKKTVMYHPHYIDNYENSMDKKQARMALGIPEAEKVLLCFGQIRRNRGYEYLLRAVEGIKDVLLIIAGEIADQPTYNSILAHLARINGKQVKLMAEWIKKDRVQILFNAADIIVLPYTDITTSGVIPLAYSFSRPVVASAIGGLREMVIEGQTGYLANPLDEADLKRAILEILGADFEGMGKNAFAFANEALSWNEAVLKLIKLYQEL